MLKGNSRGIFKVTFQNVLADTLQLGWPGSWWIVDLEISE
jgi:hypothetical protein